MRLAKWTRVVHSGLCVGNANRLQPRLGAFNNGSSITETPMYRAVFIFAALLVALIAALTVAGFVAVTSVGVYQGIQKANSSEARYKHLKALHAAYWAHHEAHWNELGREAARSWEDLEAAGLSPDVRAFLEAEGYTVVLGIKYRAVETFLSDVMLAYPAEPAWNGYQAVFMDGHVEGLSPEDFQVKLRNHEPYRDDLVVLPSPFAPALPPAEAGPPAPPPAAQIAAVPATRSPAQPPAIPVERASTTAGRLSAPPAEGTAPPPGRRGIPPFGPASRGPRMRGPGSPQRGAIEPAVERSESRSNPARAGGEIPRIAQPAAPSAEPVYIPPPDQPGTPTELAGGPEGWQFQVLDRNRRTVVGFRFQMGSWAGQPAVAQFDPLYDRGAPAGRSEVVIGRDGYVVGGLQVVAGDLVNAVRVIFVRQQTDGSLDKRDFYLSDWIGDPGKKPPQVLGDGQTRVIGVCGRHGAVKNAIALILDKP